MCGTMTRSISMTNQLRKEFGDYYGRLLLKIGIWKPNMGREGEGEGEGGYLPKKIITWVGDSTRS